MTKERTDDAARHRRWVVATCVALVLAAAGDAGPEIVESGRLVAGGFADADFTDRLTTPGGVAFVGGWLQMLSFAAAIVSGSAAVRSKKIRQRGDK